MPEYSNGGGSRGAGMLDSDDIAALFSLASRSVFDPDSPVPVRGHIVRSAGGERLIEGQGILFTAKAVASLLQAYGNHLEKILQEWDGVSAALRSPDSEVRATNFGQLIERSASGSILDADDARRVLRFIRKKDLEL